MKNVFDLLAVTDLTPDLKMLNDVCGMETVKVLLQNFNGLGFYIPKISHLDSLVEKYMTHNPDKTLKQIASELGVSEPYLKNLLKGKMRNLNFKCEH
jgi:hypothetical protein